MRFVRCSTGTEAARYAVATTEAVEAIDAAPWEAWSRTGERHPLEAVRIHAPVQPATVVGIGKNFVPDGAEVPPRPALPILFFKPPTAVAGPDDDVVLPEGIDGVSYEAELAVVIGRDARHVPSDRALRHVFGYTVANDLAATEFHHPDGHWTVSKSFDGFCPLGPAIETELDLGRVRIEGYVDGERRQRAGLDRAITGVAEMVAFVSSFMTLRPGDVLLTGTPAGAGRVGVGTLIECVVEPIGRLRNRVVRSR